MYSQKRQMGNIGEDLAVKLLWDSGFQIIKRNYLKKCGEIDIVAEKEDILYFIEVKSKFVSCETLELSMRQEISKKVIHRQLHRPEENVSTKKLIRLQKTIEIFQNEFNCHEKEFYINVLTLLICEGELIQHKWINAI